MFFHIFFSCDSSFYSFLLVTFFRVPHNVHVFVFSTAFYGRSQSHHFLYPTGLYLLLLSVFLLFLFFLSTFTPIRSVFLFAFLYRLTFIHFYISTHSLSSYSFSFFSLICSCVLLLYFFCLFLLHDVDPKSCHSCRSLS